MKKSIKSDTLPLRNDIRILYASSIIIALMVVIVSVIGVFDPKRIYPSEDLLQTFYPNDIVNLIAGLPLLLISLLLTWRGKLIGLLCWPGAIFYVLYAYFPYIICVPFNILFLPYLVIYSLSIYTFIGIVISIESSAVSRQVSGFVPARISGGILIALSALSILRQIAMIFNGLAGDSTIAPQDLAIWIDDLSFLPAMLIGGFLLWKRKPLGYTVSAGFSIVFGVMSLSLIPLLAIQSYLKSTPFKLIDIIILVLMALICLIPFAFFVRGTKNRII